MARTFKTATLGGGFGALAGNADTLRGFANANPELLAQMGGVKGLENYIKQHQQATFHNSESGGEYQFSPETRAIDDLLSGYQMNSVGAAGLEDGRAKAIVKDGQTLFTGDAYSYKPAQENLDTLMKGAALWGGAYSLFNPTTGLLGGAAPTGAGNGAFLGEGAMSGVPAWDGAMTAAQAGTGSVLGGAMPEFGMSGVDATSALGGGGSLGSMGGAAGSGIPGILKTIGGGLLKNPKLTGAIVGGLLGGGGGGGGSSGGAAPYTGPMPTITRGDWKPNAQATMMQVPTFGGGLLKTGNTGSGLWQYGGKQ